MQAIINIQWAMLILKELSRFGMQHLCIAPGSRSTPLTLAALKLNSFEIITHFDERALGFISLGLAKASGNPVGIIVTSGTAVANLLPAVVEANLVGAKLILLSADRPPELINCGANQAIIQKGIFSKHALAINLTCPKIDDINIYKLLTDINTKLHQQHTKTIPLQINCPFPEPLYLGNDTQEINFPAISKYHNLWQNGQTFSANKLVTTKTFTITASEIKQLQKKIIFIVGNVNLASAQKIINLAQTLQCPCLLDIQSGISTNKFAGYDLWLLNPQSQKILNQAELVIQFGGQIVSKRLLTYIKEHVGQKTKYWVIDNLPRNINPSLLPLKRFYVNAIQCIDKLQLHLANYQHKNWANSLVDLSDKINRKIDNYFSQNPQTISECSLAYNLPKYIKSHDLFIANSLIVRLMDMFSRLSGNEVYSNRGASGIDGLIASAIGVQKIRQKPLFLIIGDLAFLHDVNSLALLANAPAPFVIIVINNNGGAIFDFLGVSIKYKKDFYQMPHNLDFAKVSEQFNLFYHCPKNFEELYININQGLKNKKRALVIEIKTQPNSAFNEVEKIKSLILK